MKFKFCLFSGFLVGLFIIASGVISYAQTVTQNTQLYLQVAPEVAIGKRFLVFGTGQLRTFFQSDAKIATLNKGNATNIINSSYFYSAAVGLQAKVSEHWYAGFQYERYATGYDASDDLKNQAFVGWLGHRGRIGSLYFVKQLVGHVENKRDLVAANGQLAFQFGISRPISLGKFGVLQPGVSVLFGKIVSIGDIQSDPIINQIIPQAYLGYQINERINIGAMVGTDRFINTVEIGNTKENRVYANPFIGVLLRFTFNNNDDTRNKEYNPWGYRGYMLRNPII